MENLIPFKRKENPVAGNLTTSDKEAFDKLDEKLYETKSGKNVKKLLDQELKTSTGASTPEKKK